MRPFLTTARLAARTSLTRPAVPAAALVRPAPTIAFRNLTSTAPLRSRRYERFDTRSYGQPGNGPQQVHNFLRRRLGGDRGVWIFGIAVGGGVVYYVAHLERVPETGRLRFMDCSPEAEAEMGAATFNQTMQDFGGKLLPANHPVSRRVREIAQNIIEKNGLGRVKSGHSLSSIEGLWGSLGKGHVGVDDANSNTEWEVYVIDDPKTKNAFVIPGGKIFVFTGILPVSANDDGLATVLGHEVAHVVARHGAERMSYMKVLFGISFLLEAIGLDQGLTRLLVTFLLQLPNSRSSETEADTIGLDLMAKACYNPSEASRLWRRMSDGEGYAGKLDMMSTHPASGKRIKALEAQLPRAQEVRDKSCGHTGDMADSFASSSFGNQFGFRRYG